MRFAYRKEFATEPLALALTRRGWKVDAVSDPAAELLIGRADIALTPALDYARNIGVVDFSLAPGAGVCVSGVSGLLTLVFKRGLTGFERIATSDPDSSEALLARIILAEKHDLEPKLARIPARVPLGSMLASADAALLVGDDALFDPSGSVTFLDLGDEWLDMTETPLPYMVAWGRTGEVPAEALVALRDACDEAPRLIADAAATDGRPQAGLFHERILEDSVRYGLGPDDLAGLDALFRYAFFFGLVTDIASIKLLPDGDPAEIPERPDL